MAQYAQPLQLGPFFLGGQLVTAPRLYHYIAGTTTPKNIYLEREQFTILAQPFVGDANGLLNFFAHGLYKLVIKNADDTATLWQGDNLAFADSPQFLEGSVVQDPGNLVDGAGTTLVLSVTGAVIPSFVLVAPPYDLQGITCTAYVQATNTVAIRLQNETGGAIDLASGTWRARVYPAT